MISDEGVIYVVENKARLTLRSQILELLLRKMEENNYKGLTLDAIRDKFPDRTYHAIKSCINKAVKQGHVKYSIKEKLYYL